MKSQRLTPRRKTVQARHAARSVPYSVSAIELDEPDAAELDAKDGDSVPQPIDDWSDDDDANRWLDEHRFDGSEPFDIH
jgi:hypothetical protein